MDVLLLLIEEEEEIVEDNRRLRLNRRRIRDTIDPFDTPEAEFKRLYR